MKKILLISLSLIIINTGQIQTSSNENEIASKKASDKKIIPEKYRERKIFVNGRVNPIMLVITKMNGKKEHLSILGGQRREYVHESKQLKQVVCNEIHAKPTTLPQSKLNTFAVFIFNTDNRLENYHFVNKKDKQIALNKVRNSRNSEKFNEVEEKTIYLL